MTDISHLSVGGQASHITSTMLSACNETIPQNCLGYSSRSKSPGKIPPDVAAAISDRSDKLAKLRHFICSKSPGGGKFNFSQEELPEYESLLTSYTEAADKLKLLEFKKRNEVSLKLRRLCRTKDRRASKEFWRSIKGDRAQPVELNVIRTAAGEYTADTSKIKTELESKLGKVFNCQYTPPSFSELNSTVTTDIGTSPSLVTRRDNSLLTRPVDMGELNHTIKLLQPNKASGPDLVKNELLKHSGPSARTKIMDLFNCILLSQTIPSKWNTSKVILLLKRPPTYDLGNYRPISLSSCFSKLFVKIMERRLESVMESHDVLGHFQQGFRRGRGTVSYTHLTLPTKA